MDKIYWGRSSSCADFDKSLFQKFMAQSEGELKKICQGPLGEPYHLVRSEFFDLHFVNKIYQMAKVIKKNWKAQPIWMQSLLKGKSSLLYFHQPSSRTFLSFSSAASLVGLRHEEVRSIQTSSSVKGESDKDALRTLSSYFDAVVCRHPSDIYDLFAVWALRHSDREVPVINAGSGVSQHPTQSLLDYYTIKESFNGQVDGLNIGFVGDCLRGRTVHSLAKVLSLHKNIRLNFIAPEELSLDKETRNFLDMRGVNYECLSGPVSDYVKDLDVVYMTRIQDEHGGIGEVKKDYVFSLDDLNKMSKESILMHPMPKREEIDPRIDFLHRDPRVMYWRQQRNGMWVRAAIFSHLFQKSEAVLNLN
jgi:aspartate carbamoyltransferase catalytic subunit